MVLVREKQRLDLPPPSYDPSSDLFSLVIHYNGTFVHLPTGRYEGGQKVIFDNVLPKHMVFANFNTWLDAVGILKGTRRYYRLVDGGFLLLQSNRDKAYVKNNEVHLYVQRVNSDLGSLNEDSARASAGTENAEDDLETENAEDDNGDEDVVMETVDGFDEGRDSENAEDDYDSFEDADYVMSSDISQEDDDETWEQNVDADLDDSIAMGSGDEDIAVEDVNGFDEGRDSDDGKEDPYLSFNSDTVFDPTFALGLVFGTKAEFRKAVHSHAIKTKRTLKFIRNDGRRMYVRCAADGCEWRINALKIQQEMAFQIREFNHIHSCTPMFKVKNVKSKWLCDKYIQKFKSDPKRNVKGFRQDVMNEMKVHVSKNQAYRAKRRALAIIEGDPDIQYTKLWDYAEELRKTNPGSTIILGLEEDEDGNNRFSKFYCCFDAMKKGYAAGCRPVIGVDGCHLKGPHKGILLTAVGIDPNNNIYPIAYAVVSRENTETWTWFMAVLKVDLCIDADSQFTLMSDKQKGLIHASLEVFPNCNHRFCVRHLHNNFKVAGFRGLSLKNALWKAAMATTKPEFKVRMNEMKTLSEPAWEWLNDKPPTEWSKSHFDEFPKSDMLLNNLCETFNSNILEAREKPIITLLEWIREYLMRRLQENRDMAASKWNGRLCPKIQKRVETNIERIADCIPIKADAFHYQISCFDGAQYAVDLQQHSCSCRAWGLSGIPCHHAITAIVNQNWDVVDFVDQCYTVETYKKVYATPIMPINGSTLWDETSFIPPLPPNFGRGVGRPAGARRREPDEANVRSKKKSVGAQGSQRLKRQQVTLKCSICKKKGHNKTRCLMNAPANEELATTDLESNVIKNSEVVVMPNRDILPPKSTLTETVGVGHEALGSQTASNIPASNPQIIGPSMFQQLQMSQSNASRVIFRAPPPTFGYMKPCFTQYTSPPPIVLHDGKKYLDLSQESQNIAQAQHGVKGKKKKVT